MGTGPGDLHALAVELLDASVEALDTIPTFAPGLEGAPERSFVSPGPPSLDCCGQLSVHVASVLDAPTQGGLAAGRKNASAKVNHIGFVVTITRCVQGASVTLPLPEDIQATAEQTDADAWALWNHLFNLWRSGALFTLCGEVFFEGLRVLPASGGCVGWTLGIRVSLDGYEEP